jgi:dimethylargininase
MNTRKAAYAVVREVSATYDGCIRRPGIADPIDVGLARSQHQAYCKTLESLGLELVRVPADDGYPDGCYVEDPAVVVGPTALILNVGAPSRVGEADILRETLAEYKQITKMDPPATLDGGDVLFAGGRFYVGLSQRTNSAGFEWFESAVGELGYAAVPVPLGNVLHLKSACTYIGEDHVLLAPDFVDQSIFYNFQQILVSKEDEYSANCLGVNGKVLVSRGYPRTRDAIRAAGFETIEMTMSEFYKGGGSLTCLSIIF